MVHIELRASVAELEEAVRRKVPGTEEMRLCAVGGAPLVAARGLTLAEYGIGANSSLQLLGRLPGGGGELVLGGETYAVGDSGHLDLAGRGLGPAELAELARWLATEASAALTNTCLLNNPLGEGVDLGGLADATENYTGADLENLCREAALTALRESRAAADVRGEHFTVALNRTVPSLSQRLLAHHESVARKMGYNPLTLA